MTIEDAGNALYIKYQDHHLFTMIGIGSHNGKKCLYLYVKKTHPFKNITEWHGYKVILVKMGMPMAL